MSGTTVVALAEHRRSLWAEQKRRHNEGLYVEFMWPLAWDWNDVSDWLGKKFPGADFVMEFMYDSGGSTGVRWLAPNRYYLAILKLRFGG